MSNSDYSKKRTNLNDLIPQVNKSKILTALNENLFNRYLTKPETVRYIGNIGDVDTSRNAIKNIKEVDDFRQDNQLQPVVQHSSGTVKSFLTFQEFLTKLALSGVDVESFDDWGALLQFNWNPPIDFDKLINYRDYFWNDNSSPDYITIKNNLTRSNSRFQIALKSVASIATSYNIFSSNSTSIEIDGNYLTKFSVNDYIICMSEMGENILRKITSMSYSNGTQRTSIVIEGEIPDYTFTAVCNAIFYNALVSETEVVLPTDVTSLFKAGYVFSVFDTIDVLVRVESSSYDNSLGTTTIALNANDLSLIGAVNKIDTTPLLFLLQGEISAYTDNTFIYGPKSWELSDISLYWSETISVTSGTDGASSLGSPNFTDWSNNFITAGVVAGDKIQFTSGTQIGEYEIIEVFDNIIVLDKKMFNDASISYTISRTGNIFNIDSENILNRLRYTQTTDELEIFNGSTWNTVLKNASILEEVGNKNDLCATIPTDQWSSSNYWLHKDLIKDATDKTKAQIPIIEFDDCIELSDTSLATYEWDYRATVEDTYKDSNIQPSMLEIHDISITSSDEFHFDDYFNIVLNEKYGNLTDDLVSGAEIVLTGFDENDGVYKVESSQYIKIAATDRYVTKITLSQALADTNDKPVGGRIVPRNTSYGDAFNYDDSQWRFKGVKDIQSSSLVWTRNPMLDEFVYSYNTVEYSTNVYMLAQDIKFAYTVNSPEIIFDTILRDVVLYDDYQEGDIRVYINGVRQYGNFSDIDGALVDDYVGGIQFDDSVALDENDVLRIEVGEYFMEDIGRRDVLINVPSSIEGESLKEKYNLTRLRKVEQHKFAKNSYPMFRIFHDDHSPSESASEIFKYVEDSTKPVNPYIFKRIKYDYTLRDFFFENKLNSEMSDLYAYRRNGKLHTVWRHGENNEMYVPQKVGDSWNIPDSWYYNIEHDNLSEISLREIFTHASSCITEQEAGLPFVSIDSSKYYLNNNPNRALGGTIKEHNGGLDTLVSAMFSNTGLPTAIIDFAAAQYNVSLNSLKELFRDTISSVIVDITANEFSIISDTVKNTVIDRFENNDSYNELYGDSLNSSIKNFISSATALGIFQSKTPFLFNDESGNQMLSHHTGHISQIVFTNAEKEQVIKTLSGYITQSVSSESDAFPTPTIIGELLIRTNNTLKTRKIYKTSSTYQWFEIDLISILSNLLLTVEQYLYDDCLSYSERFDFSALETNPKFTQNLKQQFYRYTKRLGLNDVLSLQNTFKSSDSFTWNYSYSPIPEHPVTLTFDPTTKGCWQALYEYVYGTAYPHEQPWVLQGYSDKPSWWDATYLNSNPLNARKWESVMWVNILAGIVPFGNELPNGDTSTGISGEIETLYEFIPVNILDTPTSDGYLSDELLPPYWNSANTTHNKIRTLYDINSNYGVNTPNIHYEFGQDGTIEWMWKNSIWYNYDLMAVAYKLQPITFFNAVFDATMNVVDCLEIDKSLHKVRNHRITNFHGDLIDNTIYKSSGISQWYAFFNRYSSIDGNVSSFKNIWNNWKQNLSYLYSGMIDANNLSVFNYNFDITEKDYSLDINKAISFDVKKMNGLEATLLSVPSKYNKNRDSGIGWTTEFNGLGGEETIDVYRPQAFDISVDSNTSIFTTGKHKILSSAIVLPVGYQIIDFSQNLYNSLSSGLSNSNANYYATVIIDSSTTINLVVKGYKAQTISTLIEEINKQLGNIAVASIYYGDIRIESVNFGAGSSVDISDSGLFAGTNNFSGILDATVDEYRFLKSFELYNNLTRDFSAGAKFTVVDSTQLNGVYTVLNSYFDPQTQLTKIYVSEDVTITSETVDGYIIPENVRSIPDTWFNGMELFLDSGGTLPSPLDMFTPYYLVKVDDFSFRLSNTENGAKSGSYLTITTAGTGAHVIGNLDRTFKALSGAITNYPWRVYESDKRSVVTEVLPYQTSGIQDAVNFMIGYNDKLYDDGILFNNKDSDNKDDVYNRINDWQFYIEKFISWAYQIRAIKQEDTLRFEVVANINDNTLDMQNGGYANWANGTEIVFAKDVGSILPTPFNSPASDFTSYYVIRTNSRNKIQLALSVADALIGNAVNISDTGSGKFYIRNTNTITDYPSLVLNPCKHTVSIRHPQGLVSDVFNRNEYFFMETPKIYDINGDLLNNRQIIIYRSDKETKISLVGDIIEKNQKQFVYKTKENERAITSTGVVINKDIIEIGGFKLFLDGYEHIISFNDYGVDGSLIFSKFLGIRTPRFYMEYSRTPDFTLRPNVGGHVLQNGKIVENIEHSVESLRYLFDAYTSIENRPIVERSRKSIGYDGPKDYMDDLQINDKTQFLFWRGLIQNKGTNMAIDAFVNQPIYKEAGVDEFWAYRIACFGDNKDKIYPELKLYARDVSTKEMRLEFVTPDGGSLNDTFEAVRLTDMSRWWNQPDQIQALSPKPAFYFDSEITSISNNVENSVQVINGSYVFTLPKKSDKVIVTHVDVNTQEVRQLSENYDYYLLNTQYLVFTNVNYSNLTVSTMSYNYDAQNPATLLDKQSETVMRRIPIWHPAIDQHYHVSDYVVDIRANTDHATYNFENTSATETTWLKEKEGVVWLDTSKMKYIPYYDAKIFPDINYRIFNWGKMAEYASITMYQWTESLVPPESWADAVLSDKSGKDLLQDEKRTGEAYFRYYRNIEEGTGLDPVWIEHKDEIFEYVTALVTPDTIVENSFNAIPNVYINGFYVGTFDIELYSLYEYCYGLLLDGQESKPRPQDVVTLVFEAPTPTDDELSAGGIYKKEYPYSVTTKVDPVSHQEFNVYYFWVKNKDNKISVTGDSFISLNEAQRQMQYIPIPYMILQGLRTPEFGYGLVYGIVFDEDEYELPYRYTQLVVKGLENTVKDDDRYGLRFTRDFTLRDSLPGPSSLYSPLYLKNLHWEWKLIRERQLAKIDLFLWDRITESLVGRRVVGGVIDNSIELPTLNRIVFDNLYDADTRFGLGEEQIFMDGELAKFIILAMLNDPNSKFINVDINEFLLNNSLDTESEIMAMMYEIYNNFTTEEVNKIFFQLLYAAMTNKKHHSEIFKTSWVALHSTINVYPPSNAILRNQYFIDGECPQ